MSKLFDVCPRSTLEEMEHQEEIRVVWGSGIAGYVAESGDPVNISDAYQVSFSTEKKNLHHSEDESNMVMLNSFFFSG